MTEEQKTATAQRDERLIKSIRSSLATYQREIRFWSVVHNTRDFIQWVIVLPVFPIIVIIQAIRGDL